jgi:hypothetical protein
LKEINNMAYQFRPGQKIRFVGISAPGKVAQTGDLGEFVTYTPAHRSPVEKAVFEHGAKIGYTLVETRFNNRRWICATEEIVPIDDGTQPVSWDDCAWKPEKTEA